MTCDKVDWCEADHSEDDPRDPEWHHKEATVTAGEITLEYVLGTEAGKPYLHWYDASGYDVADVGDTTLTDLQSAIAQMQDKYLEFAKAHGEVTPD